MSVNPQPSATGEGSTEHGEHAHHPEPRDYVRIALLLAVLTLMEFSTYVFDFGALGVPLLVTLIVIKFIYVASWFMHLKFDTRVFSRLMYGGLILAFFLYLVALVIMLFASASGVEP